MIKKVIMAILKIKHKNLAIFSMLVATLIFFILFLYLDTLPSTNFVEVSYINIITLRNSTISFLFKVAPFFITIVIAMTTLTINTYSGTFLELLLSDKKIKGFIAFAFFYLTYHTLVITLVEAKIPSNGDLLEEFYIENFLVYFMDLLFALGTTALTLYTAYNVFQYSWPMTLKDRFLKNIRITMTDVQKHYIVKKKLLEDYKIQLGQHIGLFTNLLSKSIKSKDYDNTRNIINDIAGLWEEIVTYTGESLRDEYDQQFRDAIKSITDNSDYGSKFDYAGEVYEIGLTKISSVYIESFDIAYTNGEYAISDIILESIYKLVNLKNINNEDIRKTLKIYLEIFNIILRHDKRGQTSLFTKKTLAYIKSVFQEHEITDYDIYYELILMCLRLEEPKILKNVLRYFKDSFDSSVITEALYRDTFRQFQSACIYSLKNKKMKCFAELVRFFVIGGFNLNIINEVFSEKIILSNNSITGKDIELLNELLFELNENQPEEHYNRDNYYRIKLYVVWYSYYLLQVRISSERITNKYLNLNIPNAINKKIPFNLIRTVLLDLETHQKNWAKLFVGQEGYYFIRVAYHLLKTKDHFKWMMENSNYEKGSEYISECATMIKQKKKNK